MKNEGFTLVELLAVILILAFIAIIAVPIVLNIITEAKIKSLKISTSEYIRAVNTSLINEEVFNNVKDGLYTITDNGKKIVLGDKEIFINYDGRGLKSGLLLIEDSKVARVLKGLIDDYYARVTDEDIEILKNLNESTLVDGNTFNTKIKTLVGDIGNTIDTKVKTIIFLQDSILPEGITKEDLFKLQSTDLSSKTDGSIKGYYDSKTGTIYVYSDAYMSCPASLGYMFQNFRGVEKIELNLIDTSKVISMGNMFQLCSSLTELDLNGFDTSKVTNMGQLFRESKNLKKIKGLDQFNTSNVTSMAGMFSDCNNLEELDVSHFDTSKVVAMGDPWNLGMFQRCSKLTEIKGIENFDTKIVTNMGNIFNGCSSLTNLDLSKWDTSKVDFMQGMFYNCTNLKEIKFGKKFDTSLVTKMGSMFAGCSSLTSIDVISFNTEKVTEMGSMFSGCSSLKSLDLSHFDTSNVTSIGSMFIGCTNLKEIKGLGILNTSNVTIMYRVFEGCGSLETLDLSEWDISSVTDMSRMFLGCGNLREIKGLEKFDTSQVTNMELMFGNCSSLEYLDLTSFDTSLVTKMGGMFQYCNSLTSVSVTTGKWTLTYDKVGLRDDIFEYV